MQGIKAYNLFLTQRRKDAKTVKSNKRIRFNTKILCLLGFIPFIPFIPVK